MLNCSLTDVIIVLLVMIIEATLLAISYLVIRKGEKENVGGALTGNVVAFFGLMVGALGLLKPAYCSTDPAHLPSGSAFIMIVLFILWVCLTSLLIWRLWPERVIPFGQDLVENPIVDGLDAVFQVTRQDNILIATLSTGEADLHREFRAVLDVSAAIRWAACIGAVLGGNRDAAFTAGHACAYFAREGDGVRIEGFDEASSDVRTVGRFTREQAELIQTLVTPLVALPNR